MKKNAITNDAAIESINTTGGFVIRRGMTVYVRDVHGMPAVPFEVEGLSLGGAIGRRPGFAPTVVSYLRIVAA